jgi:hypothetical protein
MQTFHQSMWDYEILYADGSSGDEQLLIWPLLQTTKNTNMAGSLNLKFIFCFVETTHEAIHFGKQSLVK